MPRVWERKTDRQRRTTEEIATAVNLVLKEGYASRAVARDMGFSKSALDRHIQKAKQMQEQDKYTFIPNTTVRQIFTKEQEALLCSYLIRASRMNYGLTPLQARRLAFEYASKLNLVIPEKWNTSKLAGREWWVGFKRRQNELSLRKPSSTSLSRATAFNRTNVSEFFENLKSMYEKYKFSSDRIYNLDETGVTTVHQPPKVIAKRGQKQVGQVTSAERGQLVTMCNFISAIGNTIPPAFVFPRVNFQEHMLSHGPTGSLGLAYPTGWMTGENFTHVFQHFIKYVKPSKDTPVLLIMDNHESHVTIDIVTKARDNGVHIVTLPPHCSHRLQPLDVGVYSSFKSNYNIAANNWLLSNPGKTLTIYNIAELAGIAFNNSMSRKNILAGFKESGVFPFNENIFTDDDFLSSAVTDRPIEEAPSSNQPAINPGSQIQSSSSHSVEVRASTSFGEGQSTNEFSSPPGLSRTTIQVMLSPEDVVPFPRAAPRKGIRKGREKKKTTIITNTPEKDFLLAKIEEKKKQEQEKQMRKAERLKKKEARVAVKRKLSYIDSSEEDADDLPDLDEMSDSDFELEELEEPEFDISKEIERNDYVLVKFALKKSVLHYVGQVDDTTEDHLLSVNFLRRRGGTFNFFFPEEVDKSEVLKSDVVLQLPSPTFTGGTERIAKNLKFSIDLTKFSSSLR